MDPVAEELLLGKLFDENDLGGHEDGGLAGLVGHGDFDERLRTVPLAAFEAQAALGHVLAEDHFITLLGMANASRVSDFDARVLAALGGGTGGFLRSRQSENGAERFLEMLGMGRISRSASPANSSEAKKIRAKG